LGLGQHSTIPDTLQEKPLANEPQPGGAAGLDDPAPATAGAGAVVAGALALALAWVVGALLVHGAAREAELPVLAPLFHLAAAGAAALFTVRLAERRRHESAGAALATAPLLATLRELGAGDLVRAGELGRALPANLAPSVEAASRGIAARIERLQSSSLSVADAADGVERGLSSLAAGATEQAATAAEVTSAMEELARTAGQIAEHAERQSELVLRLESDGEAGGAAVEQALAGIASVERRIGELALGTESLGERSREIFRILELIRDIAQETHILSLNAALEAQAAGDRGRRFAVVAGEVRRLSERVRDSVASVRGELEGFAGAIRATAVAADEGRSEAGALLAEAGAAGGALGRLRAALSESSGASRQISGVTRQQTAASDEVVSTLRELRQVVERMSRDLAELAATARRLREVGLDLQVGAQSFRIDSPRSVKRLVHLWAERIAAAADAPAAQAALSELVARTPYVEAAYLADRDGRLSAIAVAPALGVGEESLAKLRGLDYHDRPWFRDAVRSGRAIVTPPQLSLLSGERCLTAALARRAPDGSPASVLGLDVSVRSWTRIGA
jgi:methyl-accepting chemotaxis protein